MIFQSSLLAKREHNPTLATFTFAKPAAMGFKPGQFIIISKSADFADPHPFSVSSCPADALLEITVRKLGNFTQGMFAASAGMLYWIKGPYGFFTLDKAKERVVLIAGGVGVTPFLSMLRHEALSPSKRKFFLLYCVKNVTDIVEKRLLDTLANENASINVIYSLSQEAPPNWQGEKGRVTQEMLEKHFPFIKDSSVYLCGPPPMVQAVKQSLVELGLPESELHVDNWDYAKKVEKGEVD